MPDAIVDLGDKEYHVEYNAQYDPGDRRQPPSVDFIIHRVVDTETGEERPDLEGEIVPELPHPLYS